MRTLKLITGIGLCLLQMAFSPGWAASPTQAELSAQALDAELHDVAPARQAQVLAERAQKLRQVAAESPNQVSGATVVFKAGKTSKEIDVLATAGGLEVSGVEVKVPVGADGRVFTIWVGERTLTMLEGSFSERLDKALGRQRFHFMNLAATKEGAEGQRFVDVAHSTQMLTYKAHVVGAAKDISKLLDNAAVSAVLLDAKPDRVNAYQQLKSRRGAITRFVIRGASSSDIKALKANGQKMPDGAQNAPVITY